MMFAYEVKCISDFSNDGTKVDVGVISAPSMTDAAKIIEGYYSGFTHFSKSYISQSFFS